MFTIGVHVGEKGRNAFPFTFPLRCVTLPITNHALIYAPYTPTFPRVYTKRCQMRDILRCILTMRSSGMAVRIYSERFGVGGGGYTMS